MKVEIILLLVLLIFFVGCEPTQESAEKPELKEQAEPSAPEKSSAEKKAAPEPCEFSEIPEQDETAKAVEELRESAREKYKNEKDPEAAAEILSQALKLELLPQQESGVRKELSTLMTLEALRLAHQKRFEDSMPLFREAAEVDSTNSFVHMEHAATLYKMGKNEEAVKAYTRAIEHKQDYHQAYNGRGLIFLNRGEDEKALADFEKALEIKPDFYWALVNKGQVLDRKSQLEEAVKLYSRAIEVSPETGLAYNNRGWAYCRMEKYPEASRDLKKAMKYSPDNPLVYLNRAYSYLMQGLKIMAIRDYEAFLDRFPDHPRADEIRQWMEKNAGKTGSAEKPEEPGESGEPAPTQPLRKP